MWVVQQQSASQSLCDATINGDVKDALITSGMSCLAAQRINLLVSSPTLSASTWRVNCGRKPGRQCDHTHNADGHTAPSRRSLTDPSCYTCQHRLTLRCSPCSAIKGSGFVTPSSQLCTTDGYQVQNQNQKKTNFRFFFKNRPKPN